MSEGVLEAIDNYNQRSECRLGKSWTVETSCSHEYSWVLTETLFRCLPISTGSYEVGEERVGEK